MEEREETELLLQQLKDRGGSGHRWLDALQHLQTDDPASFLEMLRAVHQLLDITADLKPSEARGVMQAAIDELTRNADYYGAVERQKLRRRLGVVRR